VPITTFDALIHETRKSPARRIAVAHPANAETFEAIRIALDSLPVEFVLTGDEAALTAGIRPLSVDPARVRIVHAPGPNAVPAAISVIAKGEADVLMKGSVDTATLMKAVLADGSPMRTGRTLSDVFLFEFPDPSGTRLVMITDGGLNLAPDLKAKVDLIRNAVSVGHALGIAEPRVAVLSASEFVNPALPSSVDAALLSKMNERGQITGCIVDGPLALDNAISPEAAGEKKIDAGVAGRADILLAPTIEAANLLAKSTTYFAGYQLGHVVVGATAPILIPSRADKRSAKVNSIALGLLMVGATDRGRK
jgi:phosphate butyryltransferase